MIPTHHGTSTNLTRFIISVKGTPIRKDSGIWRPGRPHGTSGPFRCSASRYVGGVETRQAANRPSADEFLPTQVSKRRGDARRGRKSCIFKSNFCWSTSDFCVVLVRPWSGGGVRFPFPGRVPVRLSDCPVVRFAARGFAPALSDCPMASLWDSHNG